jgi:hypothetical protein
MSKVHTFERQSHQNAAFSRGFEIIYQSGELIFTLANALNALKCHNAMTMVTGDTCIEQTNSASISCHCPQMGRTKTKLLQTSESGRQLTEVVAPPPGLWWPSPFQEQDFAAIDGVLLHTLSIDLVDLIDSNSIVVASPPDLEDVMAPVRPIDTECAKSILMTIQAIKVPISLV